MTAAANLFTIGKQMANPNAISNFELMVLLALIRLGDEAYGLPISQEIEEQSGHEVALGSIYAALDRLQNRDLVSSSLGDPTPERGGRAKKYFKITSKGMRVVQETQRTLMRMWKGLPNLEGGKA